MERMNSGGSSIRRRSLSISSHVSYHIENDGENESVSEAGDIGDRALGSRRFSESNSFRLSFNNRSKKEVVVSIADEHRSHPNSSVGPLPPVFTSLSPLSTNGIVGFEDIEHTPRIPPFCRGPLEPKENQELIREAILAPFLVMPNLCASLSTKEPVQRVRPTLIGPRRSPSLTRKTYSISPRNLLQA
ncbi:hypothetical protein VIGAN_11036300 [Vigna angularis var. angularis]|uniref:Uncharacterized protein n=1 Tax=Vigna angularis var. angularis TaxID=157739 RepID=A0A0S3T8E8_PHAAN|nr:hypothetical protein VIGAN_11036300 [Vigna angularis var. angularis]